MVPDETMPPTPMDFYLFRDKKVSTDALDSDPQLKKHYGGISKKSGYRCIPCYKDVNDKDTIEWRLYYWAGEKVERVAAEPNY